MSCCRSWTHMSDELDAIYAAAEARRDAGERAARRIDLAYRVPPGDGDVGVLPWLTEEEADRIQALKRELFRIDSPQAAQERLAAKRAQRDQARATLTTVCANLSFPAES